MGEGGAICILSVSVLPIVIQSFFKSGSAKAYGGAIYYFNMTQSNSATLFESFTLKITNKLGTDKSLLSITSPATLTLYSMSLTCTASYSTSNKPLISVSAGALTLTDTNAFSTIKCVQR